MVSESLFPESKIECKTFELRVESELRNFGIGTSKHIPLQGFEDQIFDYVLVILRILRIQVYVDIFEVFYEIFFYITITDQTIL